MSLKPFKRLPGNLQVVLYVFLHILGGLALSKVARELGYLFMDELGKAVSQFYPPASGGMSGGSSTPPGPFEDPSFIPINEENQQLPETSNSKRDYRQELLTDKSLSRQFRNALVKQEEISQVMAELLNNRDSTMEDIRAGVDIYLTETMELEGKSRNKKLHRLFFLKIF
uniref:Uncharacterized protein orf169b n=1 Tax=Beta vulgaris subsp. maritima TaxID=350892 RepID=E8ZCF3_BETVM|nr:hypothetical protein [Beta vulgaris subsp. maritima]